MQGGTVFNFVTDGIESALEQARRAAADTDVRIGGGATVATSIAPRASSMSWSSTSYR
jgi:dihydrofolate reductase